MSTPRPTCEMAFTYTCRVCCSNCPSRNMVALFSPTALKEELPARITDIVQLPVDERNGFPRCICQPCKRRLVTLEKAIVDLRDFRRQAQESYRTFMLAQVRSLKRTKQSSADVGVSPDTAKARPPSKKPLTAAKRLTFGFQNSSKYMLCLPKIISNVFLLCIACALSINNFIQTFFFCYYWNRHGTATATTEWSRECVYIAYFTSIGQR